METVHRINLHRNLGVRQVLNKNPKHKFSNNWVMGSQKVQEDILFIASRYGAKFTTKKVREQLGRLDDEAFPDWGHLGGVVGQNRWKEYGSAFAMLYGHPPIAAMVGLAEVLTGVPVEGEEVEVVEYIGMRDGGVHPTTVHSHTNELVAELIRHYREDQIMQLVDRLRAARALEGAKVLDFYCPVALKDLPVDEIAWREDVWPTGAEMRLEAALSKGSRIIPEFASGAAKFRSDIWNSSSTAHRDYKEFPKGWKKGLERVEIQEKSGNKKAVWGFTKKCGVPNFTFPNNYNILIESPGQKSGVPKPLIIKQQ